jgi:hypothetical protein
VTEEMTTTNAIKLDPASEWKRSLPHITALLDGGGHVTLGCVEPFHNIAIAATERKVFASLKPNKGESAADLMQRLDDALNHAAHGGAPINEISGGHFVMSRPSAGKRR